MKHDRSSLASLPYFILITMIINCLVIEITIIIIIIFNMIIKLMVINPSAIIILMLIMFIKLMAITIINQHHPHDHQPHGDHPKVASEMLPNSTERAVTVSGASEAVIQCIFHICTIMSEVST